MSAAGVVEIVLAEAALLGIGLAVRFPRFGPHDLARATLLFGGALLLVYATPALVTAIAAAAGAAAAVTLVVLPALTAVFWAAGCFFRLVASTLARGL